MSLDHYLDIQLLPDPEFAPDQLLRALFGKLHRALVQLGDGSVGISLPGHSACGTGNHLRLHGSQSALMRLQALDWLTGMRDHTRLSELAAIPADCLHRVVRRVQVDSSPERQRRRLMKRQGLDEHTARQRIPDSAMKLTHLPWVEMRSQSSGQRFRLFIEHGPLLPVATLGRFSKYGLSASATVPWF
jgi:CRISPR-associated endonuclease Csy4